MGAKNLTPQKYHGPKFNPIKSHAEFPSLKISRGTTQPRYAGTITNLQIVLNTPKNPYLNKLPKNILAKIFLLQKIPKLKISTTPKILRSPLSLEIRSTPWDLVQGSSSLHVNSPFVYTFRASYQAWCTFERTYIKRLTSFKLCATTSNNTQEHAITCNRMCKRTQNVTSNNVRSCWSTMLHPSLRINSHNFLFFDKEDEGNKKEIAGKIKQTGLLL